MEHPPSPPDCFEFLSLVAEAKRGQLQAGSSRARFRAAGVVHRPDQGDFACVVNRGLVRIYVAPATGRQATVHFVHRGELLSWGVVLHPSIKVHIQAVTDTDATRLDVDRLRRLSRVDPEVSLALLTHAAALEANSVRIISVRTLGGVRERLAFDLLDRACANQLKSTQLVIRTTQEELADSIGSVREVVARVMRGLRATGLIETSRGLIQVRDVKRLEDIVARAVV